MDKRVSVEEQDFECIKTLLTKGKHADIVNRFRIKGPHIVDYKNHSIKTFIESERKNRELGFDEGDDINVVNCFKSGVRNEDKNAFPDFVFKNGFVEHFEITSSREKKNGSSQKREDAETEREHREEIDCFEKERAKELLVQETMTYSHVRESKHSHENLLKSLKRNLIKHIGHQKKYAGPNKFKIYLINYSDIALTTLELLTKESPSNKEQLNKNEFLIKYDKEALNIIYDFKDYIDYVVFLTKFDYVIIKTTSILNIIESIESDYLFMAGETMTFNFFSKISVPFVM